jgi:hypothetical protein
MLGGVVLLGVHFYRLFGRMTRRPDKESKDDAAKLPKPLPDGPARQRERMAQARTRATDQALEASAPETVPTVSWSGVTPEKSRP